jgi:riboflavin synthase
MKKEMFYLGRMFTGIIENTGIVRDVIPSGSNKTFWIESAISSQFKVDQSISHSGACLTIEEVKDNMHIVTAIEETLQKTTLSNWRAGTLINLELCLRLNDRLDGHLVQGHVDTTGICKKRKEKDGSWEYDFEFPKKFAPLIIEKGSICIDGVSLTAFNVKRKSFSIAVIPYTFEHTTIKGVEEGAVVNIEFDLIGKYINRSRKLAL